MERASARGMTMSSAREKGREGHEEEGSSGKGRGTGVLAGEWEREEERRGRLQRQWEMVEAHGQLMSGAVGGN